MARKVDDGTKSHKTTVSQSCHKVEKFENIVSKKSSAEKKRENMFSSYFCSPSELPRKFQDCETSLKLKPCAPLREGTLRKPS